MLCLYKTWNTNKTSISSHVFLRKKVILYYCNVYKIQALILVKSPCPHMTFLASNCINTYNGNECVDSPSRTQNNVPIVFINCSIQAPKIWSNYMWLCCCSFNTSLNGTVNLVNKELMCRQVNFTFYVIVQLKQRKPLYQITINIKK